MDDPREVRTACRRGAHRAPTSGLAPGYVQANLAILPAAAAEDFLAFCRRNPKPCPVLAVSEPGDPTLPALADDLDLRTDAPSYRIYRDGEYVEDAPDILDLWEEDFVGFALGCSFSFEEALLRAGLRIRHMEAGTNVPMFRTNIETAPAGPFRGPMVVSMRPFAPAEAIRAVEITARFPKVHGAPVHLGLPHLIGIPDLGAPWQGDPVDVGADELPVFWACGITPQSAIEAARLPLFIAHTPGHMLVSDVRNADLAVGAVGEAS